MNDIQNIKSANGYRQRGFNLIEVLIGMLLALFLLAALIQILLDGKQSFAAANYLSRLQETGRVATNLVVSDLKRAGYMGGNSDVPKIVGSAGQVAPAVSCATGNTTWGRMIDEGIFGLDDTNAGYACIANASYLRGDVLVVRYASPWVAAGALTAGRLYLRSSIFEGKLFAGSNESMGTNTVMDLPQSVHEVFAYAYYVGNSGRTCNGQAVPSLFRVRLDDNAQPVAEELLPGVADFQVQYGIAGQYVDAGAVAATDWDDVVTARVWLLVRSECPETGYADTATYNLGDQAYTRNDNFRRQLYSSVVMLRN